MITIDDFEAKYYLLSNGFTIDSITNYESNGLVSDIADSVRSGVIQSNRKEEPGVEWLQTELEIDQPEYNDLTELQFSKLFGKLFSSRLRYNVTGKQWYCYDGKVWKEDAGGMYASEQVKLFSEALQLYGFRIEDNKKREEFLKYVSRYNKYNNREVLLKDARSEMYICQLDFDRTDKYFNCLNGVLDLDTFDFIKHDPKLLLSKISNVLYDPDIRSERFERFISEIMCGDMEKAIYLQKTLGYTLTADTSLEKCWIWYGETTRNGKGTLAETIAYMLGNTGGYAFTISPETLAKRKNKDTRQASGDIARLNNCRFVNASEPPKSMLFDSALLKTLTGRDSITARYLYENEFEFIPKFKIFMNTNYLPLIYDDTLFSSERINVITFDRHFEPEEQDISLKSKLREARNISGIFNWCIEGLRLYRETGLDAPEAVRETVKAYREKSDKIRNCLLDCFEPDADSIIPARELYTIYSEWCTQNGLGVEGKNTFLEELRKKPFYKDSGTVNGKTVRRVVTGYRRII